MMRPAKTLSSLVILLSFILPNTALACSEIPSSPSLPESHVVFSGQLIDYEVFEHSNGAPGKWAILSYQVDEVLRGELSDQVDAVWNGSFYGFVPETINVPSREIVRLIRPSVDQDQFSLPTSGCGYLFHIAATEQNLRLAKEAIANGSNDPIDFEFGEIDRMAVTDAGIRRRLTIWLAASGGLALAMIAITVKWLRRRKRLHLEAEP